MSDENTPKFRLRPKLAGGPAAATPVQANLPVETPRPEAVAPEAAAAPIETKPVTLRPKLALKAEVPVPVADSSSVPVPAPQKELAASSSRDPRSFPPPPAKQQLVPLSSRPKAAPAEPGNAPESTGATPPFPVTANKEKLPAVLNAPPPPRPKAAAPLRETWPAVLDAPPPPGLAPTAAVGGVEEEPAEITAIRKASTFPFPPPTAKFPPLPGLGTPDDSAPPEAEAPESFLKKLLLIGVLGILLLASAVFAYFKFFAKPSAKPASPPAPAAVQAPALPNQVMDKVRTTVEKTKQEQLAPINEVVASEPTPTPAKPDAEATPPGPGPAQTPVATTAQTETPEPAVMPTPPPVPVKPPPPPPPSLAFRAWVLNLKIRGVRGGEAQRVFIDRTSYVPGDTVNQQMGIIFTGYDESRRTLTFQDKTGATFERRD